MINTSLDSSNFYFLLAVFQGFILAFIIITRRPFRNAHFFFGLLVSLFSLSLLHLILESSISAFNVKFPIPMEFSLAYGPLAYFHIIYIKYPKRMFRRKDLIHFLPSLILDGLLFSALFLYIRNHLDWAYDNIALIQTLALGLSVLGAIQLSIYTFLIYRETIDAKKTLREFRKMKKWLSYLIILWSSIAVFLIIAVPIGLFFIEELDENIALLYMPVGVIIGISIYLPGYLYLVKYARAVEKYTDRISKLNFSEDELDLRKEQLLHALQVEKLYCDSTLTLATLAKHLDCPISTLSLIINESLQTNFNDLINDLRVIAFKSLAIAPDSSKYSVIGLGQEVGFGSKASFYRIFKKKTGLTPSQFIRSQAQIGIKRPSETSSV